MNVVAGAIMVGSAGMCLGGALHARKLLGITAATVMLYAMIDLAFVNQFSPVLWSGLLVIPAMGLGLRVENAGELNSAAGDQH